MKKYFALFGALLLAFGSASYSHAEQAPQAMSTQLTNVSGIVTDENGEPVIGATITEIGTTRVTATDINGRFNLRATGKGKIEISYIGYKSVTVNPGTNLNIRLEEDKASLDEVVVVGYGTQKKANLTGAVSNVDVSKALESKSETDVSKALQGTVPGLTILNNDGRIDSEASLVIRGIGTLSNDGVSTPLYVVDGVPTDNLTYLNSNDIETISVLKDAASTSIYGTRAAFGVVLITTKTGHVKDNVKVSYKNNFSWSQATTLPDYPNVPTQVQGLIDVNKRMGLEAELFGMYMDSPEFQAGINNWIAKHGDTKAGYREMIYGDDYDEYGYYANWDVPGIMFNKHAPAQSHNISVTGNSGRTNFYVSFGYDQRQGLHNFNPDKVKRYNATANISTQATDWLTIGARIAYTDRTYDGVSNRQNYGNAGYQYLWRWGSFFGPYGYFVNPADGKEYDARTMIGYRKQGGDRMRHMNNLRMTGFLKIDLSHGFTFNGDYTFIRKNTKYKDVGLPVNLYNTWGLAPKGPTNTLVTSTWIESDHSVYQNQVFNGYFNYNQSFNDAHNLNVMVGANLDKADYEYLYYERHDLQDVNMPELALTNEDYTYTHQHTHQGSAGFFGRINYDYKGIYLLEVNGRYDGSSKFPSKDQWAFFPSFSVGYRISEEAFWEPIKNTVNNAKLRASYGVIGNQEIGANMFLETMSKVSNGVYWMGTGSSRYDYFGAPKLVSSSLTWEKIKTTNVGIDLSFLRGEINFSFDWYQRDTKDMLAPGKTLPAVLGTTAAWENAGSLRTRGWEVTIDWRHRFGDANVYATFNLSDYKTTVTEWNSNNLLNTNYTGKEYGAIWGFETDRYFDFSDFNGQNADGSWNYKDGVANQTKLQSGGFVFGPGDIKFVDQNGDGVIDWGAGTDEDHGDLIKIGNTTPRFQYSLRLGGDWKGFDLDLYLQGVGKRKVWTQSAFVMPMMRGADALYANQTDYITEAEFAAGTIRQDADFPRMWGGGAGQGTASGDILSGGRYNFYPQTKYLVNMAYLRMKNITLGYTIPQNLTRKIRIDRIRVYAAINNAFDIINHNKGTGIDPEMNNGEGSYGNGVWGRIDPIMRSYSFGIQIDI
ncbi:MAG: TonB-dependent receptor [Muribaculaceae bacterium]|nr:TonB-dependent receptor [Muribaculaceae bacterium]MBR0023038.1 TonB-dependent receptor [Muribaculaceae bacterium]